MNRSCFARLVALAGLLLLGLAFLPNARTTVRAADPPVSWEKDLQALQGEWLCVEEEHNGKKMGPGAVKERNRRLIVKGNKVVMKRDEKGIRGQMEGRIELNPSVMPAHFDLTGKDYSGVYTEVTGIYELKEDMLRLCILTVEKGAKRPKEFATEEGGKSECFTFKRDKG